MIELPKRDFFDKAKPSVRREKGNQLARGKEGGISTEQTGVSKEEGLRLSEK